MCVAAHRSLSTCLFTCLCHPVCLLVWLCGSGTVRRVDAFYLCVNVGDDADDSDNDVDGCDVDDSGDDSDNDVDGCARQSESVPLVFATAR